MSRQNLSIIPLRHGNSQSTSPTHRNLGAIWVQGTPYATSL
jgi:hypothetical protein